MKLLQFLVNSKFKLVLISFLVFLVSCQFLVKVDILINDLIKAIDGNVVYTKSNIKFQMASDENCQKEKENLSGIISKYFKNVEDTKCEKESSNSYLSFNAGIPILEESKVKSNTEKSMISIAVSKTVYKDASSYDMILGIDKKMFEELNQEITNKYFQNVKIENLSIKLSLKNNTESSFGVKAYSLYINNKANPVMGLYDLKPEDVMDIRIPDIMRDYIYENGSRRIIEFRQSDSGSETGIITKEKIKKPDSTSSDCSCSSDKECKVVDGKCACDDCKNKGKESCESCKTSKSECKDCKGDCGCADKECKVVDGKCACDDCKNKGKESCESCKTDKKVQKNDPVKKDSTDKKAPSKKNESKTDSIDFEDLEENTKMNDL